MNTRTTIKQVDEMQLGIDRYPITYEGQNKIEEENLTIDNDEELHHDLIEHGGSEQSPEHSSVHDLKASIKQKTQNAKIKLKRTLHIDRDTDESGTPHKLVLASTAEERSNSRLDGEQPVPDGHSAKDLLHNPVDTIKDKVYNRRNCQVAETLATKEIPHGQEVDLAKASIALEQAASEAEKRYALRKVEELLKERQNTYARWTLDRHVTKLRVSPRVSFVRKTRRDFETRNGRGEVHLDRKAYSIHILDSYAHRYGAQYIGYGSDPPNPTRETIMQNIERFIISSSPLQEFLMNTRRVYRWQDRAETAKYLVIYFVLWYFDLLLPGLLSAVFYLVIARRVNPHSLHHLTEDIKRREDIHSTALSLTELIDKVGEEQYPDSLLEHVGPWLIIQLADLSNFLETVQNFYQWRNPPRTLTLLALLPPTILLTALLPSATLLKASTLAAGLTFFALFPLATNYPAYRLLVSPSKRLLWNVPTHAEWAVAYVQAAGARAREGVAQGTQAQCVGTYTAQLGSRHGILRLSTTHISFSATPTTAAAVAHPSPDFSIPYAHLITLEKVNHVLSSHMPRKLARDMRRDLRLGDAGGRQWVLEDVQGRDEVFSQIVGFSAGREWQVVW
ncbi:hypothetical protein IQ07DRAFT_573080 [Pyrenochaeta sp. DS3sAY3a]|nr:hypothetical protein IQ07DRAFT_573080 [Pyrenochaeta sp. DS3sAY3a]